jgi:hypothetical protein
MEFVKLGKRYLIKDTPNIVVSEEEKLKLERKELVLKDIESPECQKETTKKIRKLNKKIKEVENETIKETE